MQFGWSGILASHYITNGRSGRYKVREGFYPVRLTDSAAVNALLPLQKRKTDDGRRLSWSGILANPTTLQTVGRGVLKVREGFYPVRLTDSAAVNALLPLQKRKTDDGRRLSALAKLRYKHRVKSQRGLLPCSFDNSAAVNALLPF